MTAAVVALIGLKGRIEMLSINTLRKNMLKYNPGRRVMRLVGKAEMLMLLTVASTKLGSSFETSFSAEKARKPWEKVHSEEHPLIFTRKKQEQAILTFGVENYGY